MDRRFARPVVAILALATIGFVSDLRLGSKPKDPAMPPPSIPTFSTENVGREAFFYVGGKYEGAPGKEEMHGAMYVEVMVPKQIKQKYPIVFFHGNGQTGAVWKQTPDNRPGWAYYLINQGYVVYMVDYPARGRSPYVPGMDGKLGMRTALELEQIWTGPVPSGGDFPRMKLYTQWPSDSPKKGTMGDPVFDNFIKGQMQFVAGQAELAVPAGVALLDQIGSPVILITHSQGGGIGFNVADERPNLIAGMVSIEPGGPQIGMVDTAKVKYTRQIRNSWGLTTMPMHYDPPVNNPDGSENLSRRKIRTAGMKSPATCRRNRFTSLSTSRTFNILSISAEGTYHRVFDVCIPKWINQAGGQTISSAWKTRASTATCTRCFSTRTATRSSSSSTSGCART